MISYCRTGVSNDETLYLQRNFQSMQSKKLIQNTLKSTILLILVFVEEIWQKIKVGTINKYKQIIFIISLFLMQI